MTTLFPAKTPGATIPIHMEPGQATASSGDWLDTAFHDLIDIVNPLQHLPVVGTLYRYATGAHIGTVEKIAGDALYGGLWGAVSSLADTAFEAATGKDFGTTILSFLTGEDAPAKPALAAAPPPASAQAAAAQTGDVAALGQALTAHGVEGGLAARALYAYRQANGLMVAAAH